MKRVIIPFALALLAFQLQATKLDVFFQQTDAFLKKNVKNGLVNYKAIKANNSELQNLVDQIEVMSVSADANPRSAAFFINAYNILVIHNIVKLYPLKSPMDVSGFFDTKKHKVANEYMTLNDIENKKLRAVYNDPRHHFVLVCAALGCPKITSYAYTPENLEKKLDVRTKVAINDPNFIRVKPNSKMVLISEIFKWYKGDFITGEDNQSFIDFLNKYRYDDKKIDGKLKVDFYPYNWNLNTL